MLTMRVLQTPLCGQKQNYFWYMVTSPEKTPDMKF